MSNHDDGIDLEEKFFHNDDEAKIQALKKKLETEKAEKEAQELKVLHHLRCGKCGDTMDPQLFKGIEIEVCATCGAVLLDPGELQELVGDDESDIVKTIGDFFQFSRKS